MIAASLHPTISLPALIDFTLDSLKVQFDSLYDGQSSLFLSNLDPDQIRKKSDLLKSLRGEIRDAGSDVLSAAVAILESSEVSPAKLARLKSLVGLSE